MIKRVFGANDAAKEIIILKETENDLLKLDVAEMVQEMKMRHRFVFDFFSELFFLTCIDRTRYGAVKCWGNYNYGQLGIVS